MRGQYCDLRNALLDVVPQRPVLVFSTIWYFWYYHTSVQRRTYHQMSALSPVSIMLAYLSMLFILGLACTAWSKGQVKNK